MMVQLIDRRKLKADTRLLLMNAHVSPKAMTALYLALTLVLELLNSFCGDLTVGLAATFIHVLTTLLSMVLGAGFILYCMAIRRGERAEFLTLFDGFSFVGKVIALSIVKYIFIILWACLFVIPGIIAAYRYRFALYNLCEDPSIGIMEAIRMSKRQTLGYKSQLFMLDLSYLGWGILSGLPAAVFSGIASYQAASALYYGASVSSISLDTASEPFQVLIVGVWALAVALFYLPNYQCVELGYFDIAKESSGVGYSASAPGGPDDGPSFY